MKLSACVIVKNEEANLPLWLDSMQQIADEMVVVDTGSTDGTVELAKAAGARVFFFPWVNDFSAAKNFAIEQAKGDWILFLDADEYFPKEHCRIARQMIEKCRLNPKLTEMAFLRINIEKETGQDQGTSMYVTRCFRNCAWLRYQGKIHENLADISGKGRSVVQYVRDVVIYHTGYSDAVVRDKLRRNLEFLKEKERLQETQPLDDFYFADCYYGLGDYEAAAEYARKAVAEGIEPVSLEERPHSIWVQSLMVLKRSQNEVIEALGDATKKFPQDARFYMLWGIFDWDRGAYSDAEKHFRLGRELYQKVQKKNPFKASQAAQFFSTTCFCLGEIAAWKGMRQNAMAYLAEGLQRNNRSAAALRRLCILLEDAPIVETISFLNGLYDKEKDSEFLMGILAGTKLREACLYYEKYAGKRLLSNYERCLFAGKLAEAAAWIIDSNKTSCETMFRTTPLHEI